MSLNPESARLLETRAHHAPWRKWGPYLSERQWGTVREDYSRDGDAWNYFTHDQARSRAYHWGEDGLAGICDENQILCFAVALWNGRDPILKERLFGLTNSEGNHGEDVKEYYFYLDSTPTHSYMKYLYKYPQAAYPYEDLVSTNGQRGRHDFEYELLDTGVFDGDRYFDVFVEYAKDTPDDILIQIQVVNRGPAVATLHVLPSLWFRNTWSWWPEVQRPLLKEAQAELGTRVVEAGCRELGWRMLYCENAPPLLFTENETNTRRLFGTPNATPYVKDGINDYVVSGRKDAVNPDQTGTKCAAHYQLSIQPGGTETIRLRLGDPTAGSARPFGREFADVLETRRREADEFYRSITPENTSEDRARVMRQAMAGMLWSKQYFGFDVDKWLEEHREKADTPPANLRNADWFHMINQNVISMPDKWEYPWYAAWDLAFQALAISTVDLDFAKAQLDLLLQQFFIHPSGQIPAYEWNFSDVNPPVHAWATIFLYRKELALRGKGDVEFLMRSFQKLMLNFSWWINRKDRFGKNIFEGGFLGLDNIGVFDRSATMPDGGHMEQADGTAWMALFCQNMLEIAVELAIHDPGYDDMAAKFVDHFLWIARATNRLGPDGLWDEEDGFYYDVLRYPDGRAVRLKVRSMVGLLPLCATTIAEPEQRAKLPRTLATWDERLRRMPDLIDTIHPTGAGHRGIGDRGIFALVGPDRLRRVLSRMLDPEEFLSPHGIRAVSRYHAAHPYVLKIDSQEYRVDYLPAESDSGMFGGNSNWRGPVWVPVNVMLIRALMNYYLYYGDTFQVECPTGSGNLMNLFEVARELSERLIRIFVRDEHGRRAVYGGIERFQSDPNWKDCLLFHEYFHGDNGAGLGASHQTGWTGLVGSLIEFFGQVDGARFLKGGRRDMYSRGKLRMDLDLEPALTHGN
jgi:Mannosylglycerate hydrolase MGH1-like glycoside hydrolase domain